MHAKLKLLLHESEGNFRGKRLAAPQRRAIRRRRSLSSRLMEALDGLLQEAKRLETERKFKDAEKRWTEFIRHCAGEMDRGRKNLGDL